MKRIAFVCAALLAAGACSFHTPLAGAFGYEDDDITCSDGWDNNDNGLIDCADPSCIYHSTVCGEDIPLVPHGRHIENSVGLCIDNIDNDYNGKTDCGDPNCGPIQNLCCSGEFTDALCTDGIDNDQNGFTDCEDFGCKHGIFVTECSEKTDKTCSDGKDNDLDGLTDCDQQSCWKTTPCQPKSCHPGDSCYAPQENSYALCTDGLDNDGDGMADCKDPSCCPGANGCADSKIPGLSAYCTQPGESANNRIENTLALCSDGIDNDHNGYTDCGDYSCSQNGDTKILAYCASIGEIGCAKCSDGIDNDGDGYTDCADYACSKDTTTAEQCKQQPSLASCCPAGSTYNGVVVHTVKELCDEMLERTPEKCRDGIDNDKNGFTDCGDDNCAKQALDPNTLAVCWESLASSNNANSVDPKRCCDCLDNDNDGFVDFDDWDCAWNPLVLPDPSKSVYDPANASPCGPQYDAARCPGPDGKPRVNHTGPGGVCVDQDPGGLPIYHPETECHPVIPEDLTCPPP